MRAVELGDRADRDRLRAALRRDPALHVYELGDLDDRFWPRTRWHALERGDGTLAAVALIYDPGLADTVPVLVALGDDGDQRALLAAIAGALPPRLYAHLSGGLAASLAPRFVNDVVGELYKMSLGPDGAGRCAAADARGVELLVPAQRDEVAAFYDAAYPGHWFDPEMLDSGHYHAVRERGEIVAAGGVHVFSASERVAALGNIAVGGAHRRRGFATRVTAAVCRSLAAETDVIGLNVRADNAAAITCYTRLGFTSIATYEESRLTARHFTPDYVERAVLRDGAAVRLRLVAPEDKALLRAGFDRWSQGSRYARFLTPKAALSDDELRYLTEVDHERHFAIGAVREDGDGHGEPIGLGIARFVRLADEPGRAPTAEAAIAVADDAQGRGLGKLLFLRLCAAARERGVERVRCELLCSNAAMRELIRQVAPEEIVEIGGGVMTLEVALPAVEPAAPVVTAAPVESGYRLLRAAAANALEWTEAVRRLWRKE